MSLNALTSALRLQRCLCVEQCQEWEVCRTVILTSLLSGVGNLPKVGPAALVVQRHGVVGMFSVEQPLAGKDGRGLASFRWGLCWWSLACLFLVGPSVPVDDPLPQIVGHWEAGFPRTLGCFEPN